VLFAQKPLQLKNTIFIMHHHHIGENVCLTNGRMNKNIMKLGNNQRMNVKIDFQICLLSILKSLWGTNLVIIEPSFSMATILGVPPLIYIK
jgi:hypothetical protein